MTAMLEKNRDNIAKALPGLAKFEITQGETVANGRLLQRVRPQPLFRADSSSRSSTTLSGFRRGVDTGQPPDNAGTRALTPVARTTAFRSPADVGWHGRDDRE